MSAEEEAWKKTGRLTGKQTKEVPDQVSHSVSGPPTQYDWTGLDKQTELVSYWSTGLL